MQQFENILQTLTGARFTIATINGTAALHTALKISGVEERDEVITQPLSFVATANAINYCGAQPVFIDVEKKTLGMNPDALADFLKCHCRIHDTSCINRITNRRISACVPMHTFGHPCRITEIVEICDRFHIKVVEDAAEALGSVYRGKNAGTFGKVGIFSFNGNKTVTSGGGGAIITDDERLANHARHLTTTAKIPHPFAYVHDEIGYNYRMPNINAALACAQMEQIDHFIEKKRNLARQYASFFEDRTESFFLEPENARSNYWLNTLILDDRKERDLFLEETNRSDILTRPAWTLLNKFSMYENCQTDSLKRAQWLEDRIVNIPSSVS